MRTGWLFIAMGSVGLSLAPVAKAQPQACEPTSLEVVVTPKVPEDECHRLLQLERIAAYSWQLFIALNWPAARGARGTPDGDDPSRIADRTAPRVWETWKSVEETFIPGGRRPDAWDEPATHRVCSNSEELEPSPTKVLADINQSNRMGRAIGPLIAQNRTYVRYEVRMRRVGFEKIVAEELYRRGDRRIELPNGSINVKAAWREVRPGENTDRYYRTEALALDPSNGRCEKRSFVLIGLHIVQKTPRRPQWIWSTFEHVDNIAVGPDAPAGTRPSLNDPTKEQVPGDPPPPIHRGNPPGPDPEPVQVVVVSPFGGPGADERKQNAKWQGSPELEGTVWRFYKLIRTQWPSNPADPTDPLLGRPLPADDVFNSTLETYQQDVTCMSCHLNSRTDFTWFIRMRAHPLPPDVRSNAQSFYDTVIDFGKAVLKSLGQP